MLERTKKPHTSKIFFSVLCPVNKVQDAKGYLRRMGCEIEDSLDVDQVFPDRSPARFLSGARYRENITQQELADKTGIPRRHISEMENKKRPIGKKNAQKLAKALKVNYQRLL